MKHSNRWQIQQRLSIEADKSEEFKKQLLANPQETLNKFFKENNEEFDAQLPKKKLKFRVIEEKSNEWIMVLTKNKW